MTAPDWIYGSFFGNSLRDWTVAGGGSAVAIAAILGIRHLAVKRLAALAARTETIVDDALVELARSISTPLVVLIVLCNAGLWLDFSGRTHRALLISATVLAILQGARSGSILVTWWLAHFSKSHGELDRTTLSALGVAVKVLVWIALAVVGAENLGLHISGLLTAFGIGGIAIALALQNILGDLFAALSIVLDKPFIVGESIAVDGFEGTVEHIGIKTTRVSSINGELVIFSNADLLKSRVRNLSRRQGLRMVFTITVDPATRAEQLARVPAIVTEAVGAEPRAMLRYSNLTGAGARGFDVETAILIPARYGEALDARQAILLGCYARLEREGIALAPPVPVTR
jgi:small-conductance mechanosensitive channel